MFKSKTTLKYISLVYVIVSVFSISNAAVSPVLLQRFGGTFNAPIVQQSRTCGLGNDSNSCFMNSAVQILYPELNRLFAEQGNLEARLRVRQEGPFLLNLWNAINGTNGDITRPGLTLNAFRRDNCRNINGTNMLRGVQDAGEFLLYCMQAMATVSNIFSIQTRQVFSHFDGSHQSVAAPEVHTALSLPFPQDDHHEEIALEAMLENYFTPEDIEGWRCPQHANGCRVNVHIKRTRIAQLPAILALGFRRFNFIDPRRVDKITTSVICPLRGLDMRNYLNGVVPGVATVYDLNALLIHVGTRANSGHYFAYVKRDGHWFKFNDSSVTHVEERDIELACRDQYNTVYMAFYKLNNTN